MHQQQLLSYATHAGFLRPTSEDDETKRFRFPGYERWFQLPAQKKRHLSRHEMDQLRKFYRTVYDEFTSSNDQELLELNNEVDVYYRLCLDERTKINCREGERHGTGRMNHLVATNQTEDENARYAFGTRPAVMREKHFYGYVQYYCTHKFRDEVRMLMYIEYIKVEEHHGLVEQIANWVEQFADISVVLHQCALVEAFGKKKYIMDERDSIEERLRQFLTDVEG
jgi:hypothetical protein